MTSPTSLLPNEPLPWADGLYSIKRHGVSISNCDSEPVQTPGCIQAHGVLLVLYPGDLTVLQVSENVAAHFGEIPEYYLGGPAEAVLGKDGGAKLRDFCERETIDRNPIYAFTQALGPDGSEYDLLVHGMDGLIVLECEPRPEAEERQVDSYSLVKRSVTRLQSAVTLDEFCQTVAAEVRAVTGIDRVMVYKFHEDFHGEVVAESKREDLAPWLGLHYPAEDIPWPAREIFKKIWVRPLPDAAGPLIEIVPLKNPLTGKALDMTHCGLRGASVMYTEYLANMGVAASLTMSLMVEGQLWGLIACQHQTPTRFPFQIRAACEFLAQAASLQLRAVEQKESLEYRLRLEEMHNRVVANAAHHGDLTALASAKPNLLDPMDAGGVAVYHENRWWTAGETPEDAGLDGLREWLATRAEFQHAFRPVFATDSLVRHYPAAEKFAAVGSGLLAIPLSRKKNTLILWFRPETMTTVKWGGNPHEKPVVPGPHGMRLTPRRSFEIFTESVRHRSLPWKRVEIDSSLRLRTLILELVVSRAEHIAELNTELSRANEELDAFAYVASHDLKEPLRGISKYAHLLLEGATEEDAERRAKLEGLRRLAMRMDTLLDSLLHFSRVGRAAAHFHPVELEPVLEEALEMVSARRQEIPTEIRIKGPLPSVSCDRVRVREIFVNLISNALKYNSNASRVVEIGHTGVDHAEPAYYVRDNGIGIAEKHHEVIFTIFKRLHGRDDFGGGSGAGLAIVKRLVDQHNGRIWLESEPGTGTTFYFTLFPSHP